MVRAPLASWKRSPPPLAPLIPSQARKGVCHSCCWSRQARLAALRGSTSVPFHHALAAPCLGSLQPSIATAPHERAQPNTQRGSMQAWANGAAAQASSASDSNQGVPSRRACECMAPVRQEASKADEGGARESNLYRRVGGANPKKDSKSDCVVKGGESSLAAWFRHELARSTAQREVLKPPRRERLDRVRLSKRSGSGMRNLSL